MANRSDNTMAKRSDNELQYTIQKTEYRATRTPLKKNPEMNSCTPEGTSVTLVVNPGISYEREKDRIVITTNRTCPWSFVTQNMLSWSWW